MVISVSAHSLHQAEDVLILLQALAATGIGVDSFQARMMDVTAEDAQPYAQTDKIPIRIGRQRYIVRELAAAAVAGLGEIMQQWEAEDGRALLAPLLALLEPCIKVLRAGSPLMLQAAGDHVLVRSPAKLEQTLPHQEVLLMLGALGLWDEQTGQLNKEEFILLPA